MWLEPNRIIGDLEFWGLIPIGIDRDYIKKNTDPEDSIPSLQKLGNPDISEISDPVLP